METDSNVERIRRVYEGIGSGDPSAFMAVLDPNVVWHVPGKSWIGGDYTGLPEVIRFFMNVGRLTGGTFAPIPKDIVGNDRHVVSIVEAKASMDGRDLAVPICVVWTFDGEKVVEVREHIFDPYAVDSFWGDVTPDS